MTEMTGMTLGEANTFFFQNYNGHMFFFHALANQYEAWHWPAKEAAARRHTTDNPDPVVVAEATITGEDPDDLARRIIERADNRNQFMAKFAGIRRKYDVDIMAATTDAERGTIAVDADTALRAALSSHHPHAWWDNALPVVPAPEDTMSGGGGGENPPADPPPE